MHMIQTILHNLQFVHITLYSPSFFIATKGNSFKYMSRCFFRSSGSIARRSDSSFPRNLLASGLRSGETPKPLPFGRRLAASITSSRSSRLRKRNMIRRLCSSPPGRLCTAWKYIPLTTFSSSFSCSTKNVK